MNQNPYVSPTAPSIESHGPKSVRRLRWLTILSAIAILIGIIIVPLSYMIAFSQIAKADAPKPGDLANYIAMASVAASVGVCLIVIGGVGVVAALVLGRTDRKRRE